LSIISLISCNSNKNNSSIHSIDSLSTENKAKNTESLAVIDTIKLPYNSYLLNLDSDNILDTIVLLQDKYKLENSKLLPLIGHFHEVIIKTQNCNYSHFNEDGWVKLEFQENGLYIDSKIKKYLNNKLLIKSNDIMVFEITENIIGIMMLTYPYASDPELYTLIGIYKDNKNKPQILYHDYLYIDSICDINNDNIPEIIGKPYHKDGLHDQINSFPTKIYKLKDTFEYDSIISNEYNRKYSKSNHW